jgi:hypothetical protein
MAMTEGRHAVPSRIALIDRLRRTVGRQKGDVGCEGCSGVHASKDCWWMEGGRIERGWHPCVLAPVTARFDCSCRLALFRRFKLSVVIPIFWSSKLQQAVDVDG